MEWLSSKLSTRWRPESADHQEDHLQQWQSQVVLQRDLHPAVKKEKHKRLTKEKVVLRLLLQQLIQIFQKLHRLHISSATLRESHLMQLQLQKLHQLAEMI